MLCQNVRVNCQLFGHGNERLKNRLPQISGNCLPARRPVTSLPCRGTPRTAPPSVRAVAQDTPFADIIHMRDSNQSLIYTLLYVWTFLS